MRFKQLSFLAENFIPYPNNLGFRTSLLKTKLFYENIAHGCVQSQIYCFSLEKYFYRYIQCILYAITICLCITTSIK